ncbi:MAG: hypothetical protein V1807_01560 [Patescibacteria group bacterium]
MKIAVLILGAMSGLIGIIGFFSFRNSTILGQPVLSGSEGFWVLFFAVFTLIASLVVLYEPVFPGLAMIIVGILSIVVLQLAYVIPGIIMIIAGILAIVAGIREKSA